MNVSIALIGYEHVGKSTIINSFIGNKISKINTINESLKFKCSFFNCALSN